MIEAILSEAWTLYNEMAIYLLFGFAVAGVLYVFFPTSFVQRHLGRGSFGSVLKAAAFGVPLPLCSCGVLPTALSLHKRGASKGATTAFLISTPQTGVDSLLATYSLLGPVFMIVRPIAALVTGVIGGVLVNLFGRSSDSQSSGRGTLPRDLLSPPSPGEETASARPGEKKQPTPDHPPAPARPGFRAGPLSPRERVGVREGASPRARANKSQGKEAQPMPARPGFRAGLHHAFVELPDDIALWLIVGIVAAGAITYAVPDAFFREAIGGGLAAMLLMMVVGIPLYVCATASIPIVAALMLKGLSPGAGLVFLMTGPATNAATVTLIWRQLGRRVAWIYLLSIAGGSLAFGALLDGAYTAFSIDTTLATGGHAMLPGWLKAGAAIVFGAVLLASFLRSTRAGIARQAKACGCGCDAKKREGTPIALAIEGMTCENCAGKVRNALQSVEGATDAETDIAGAVARVWGQVDAAQAIEALHRAGYGARRGEKG